MCLWHALLTEREIINKITFSTVCAVHGLLLTECLSIELVSIFFFLAASEDFACSNCYLEILSETSVHAAFKQIH